MTRSHSTLSLYHPYQQNQIMLAHRHGFDLTLYIDPRFSWQQMEQIRLGLENGLDVSTYAHQSFSVEQMEEIRLSLTPSSPDDSIKPELSSPMPNASALKIKKQNLDSLSQYLFHFISLLYKKLRFFIFLILFFFSSSFVSICQISKSTLAPILLQNFQSIGTDFVSSFNHLISASPFPTLILIETEIDEPKAFDCTAYLQSATDFLHQDLTEKVHCESSLNFNNDSLAIVEFHVTDFLGHTSSAQLLVHKAPPPKPNKKPNTPQSPTSVETSNQNDDFSPSSSPQFGQWEIIEEESWSNSGSYEVPYDVIVEFE